MEQASFAQFACMARLVADEARRLGLAPPAFRTPPLAAGADRTVRHAGEGRSVVAVRVRGRSAAAVLADLAEGVVVANRLRGETAAGARTALVAAAAPIVSAPARVA